MNPNNARDFKKMKSAAQHSYGQLEPFRKTRMEHLERFVGFHYGNKKGKLRVPINIVALATLIYTRILFPKKPRFLCDTRSNDNELKAKAANFGLGLNHLLGEINYKRQFDAFLLNAMFSMGIMKIGMAEWGTVEVDGELLDYGQPFARNVDLDDWVHDCQARTWDELSFMGTRIRRPLDVVKECKLFDAGVRAKLGKTGRIQPKEGEDRAATLSGERSENEDYEDYVDLWEMWYPRDNLIVTYAAGQGEDKALSVREFEGPECGPYNKLAFIDAPNNILPVPPCSHWADLHDLINRLMRKLDDQASNQKTVTLVKKSNKKDGQAVIDSRNLDVLGVEDPLGINQVKFNGPDAAVLALVLQSKELADWMAGGLSQQGGLGAVADTLGQEQLVAQASSAQSAEMKDRTHTSLGEQGVALGWYLWHDPLITIPLVKRVPGTDVEIQTEFTPEDREGDFYEYNITVEPYSAGDTNPAAKLKTLNEFVQTVLLPTMQFAQAQGMEVDFEQLYRLYAKYANFDDLETLLKFARPPVPQPGDPRTPIQPGVEGGKPKGVYTHVSKSTARSGGQTKNMIGALLGAGGVANQESEQFAGMNA